MRKLICLFLISMFLSMTSTYAVESFVRAEYGDCNIRTAPNLNGESIDILYHGEIAEYAGETKTDSRGVDWYKIQLNNGDGWISSRYAALCIDGNNINPIKDANTKITPGKYIGKYGYSAIISNDSTNIRLHDIDGSLLIRCPFDLKQDSSGMIFAVNSQFEFYLMNFNASPIILLYRNDVFIDILKRYR